MLLGDIMSPARIRVPLLGRDKQAVLSELVHLVTDGGGGQFDDILRAVQAREAVLSTGIGYGVAIPHGKSPTLSDLRLAAGVADAPIGFESLDGQPVRLFFLLVGPESASAAHVKALARISRLVRREPFRQRLLQARDPEEFYRSLCDAERS
ncbi:MAG: PTS sugar transporter subunit IIA [Gemmatimonadetes bacterium]|nr:PTS sugar transporter subunit IIA [Gemmatimonadota bacterium]